VGLEWLESLVKAHSVGFPIWEIFPQEFGLSLQFFRAAAEGARRIAVPSAHCVIVIG